MKISYNWLKQFINIDWDAEKTGKLLTDLGLEVEGIEAFTSVKGGLEGIVVGHVISCQQHPNADRLKITKVDIGQEKPLAIVCGAPNVDAGQKVPVALIGTTLYDKDGKSWKIKKGKIRGEVSEGMICAEDELGLGTNHDGIMILDNTATAGTPLNQVITIENDSVFEIGLTPNRADAMSHWGVARDLKAGLLRNNVLVELITPSTSKFNIENRTGKVTINVLDNFLAPRYCGVTISGLTVKDSPLWLQNRLKAIGLTPINNIVDATNYVLHDLGQPLHAFDLDKIESKTIEVKNLPEGTPFTTLDGIERKLSREDLMICDAVKPLCIAGVFGGLESGVTKDTTSIFLESAYFNPISIRKTAKRHGLNTDASFRFERGIDPNSTEYALKRAVLLIQEIAGGEVTSDIEDIYPKKIESHQVFLAYANANRLIGEKIPKEIIKEILTSLEIKINNSTETGIGMTIPAYRNDITREADVVEEILRVYGYNNIHTSEKLNASLSFSEGINDTEIQNKIASQLTALGFFETMTNSLTSPKYIELDTTLLTSQSVEILNPLSNDLSVMRQHMLFSMLETMAYNHNRKAKNINLFEFGKTYRKIKENYIEQKHLAIAVSGARNQNNWTTPSQAKTFFYLKGIVYAVLKRLGLSETTEKEIDNNIFSEGLSISINNKKIVDFGIVSTQITSHFGIETEILYADFDWDTILQVIPTENLNVKPISKFPSVKRDLALLLDHSIRFKELQEAALKTEKQLLKNVLLFDVYTGKNLPKGKKSYALSFTLQDNRKTLTDKQIDKIMKKLQQQFEKEFGAVLR